MCNLKNHVQREFFTESWLKFFPVISVSEETNELQPPQRTTSK